MEHNKSLRSDDKVGSGLQLGSTGSESTMNGRNGSVASVGYKDVALDQSKQSALKLKKGRKPVRSPRLIYVIVTLILIKRLIQCRSIPHKKSVSNATAMHKLPLESVARNISAS